MEQPDAAGLLEIARVTLAEQVTPHLQGDARFKALMVANAMAIALRALSAPPIAELPDTERVCAAIRAGRHDDDAKLAGFLLALAESRCRISAPKAL
jgi:hypothetical protein